MYEKKGYKIRDKEIQNEIATANICYVYGIPYKKVSKLPTKDFYKKAIIAEFVKRTM